MDGFNLGKAMEEILNMIVFSDNEIGGLKND